MIIPQNAKNLIDLINNSGYQAFAVGGFVRDNLMGRECGDIDIASSALPNELEAIFDANGIKYIETGLKHGTITAIIDHIPYEITTFRVDGDYQDNRHPDDVQFVRSIDEDLARRDFTVNAIAYNDIDGIIDLFGGKQDIEDKIIRCVGDPDKRFQEDALRIMRALRFASVLDFDIEPNTKAAILRNKELLKNIANERVFIELNKLLLGDNVEKILLEYRDVIAVIIPEIIPCFDYPQHTKWHIHDVYTHIVKSVAVTPKIDYMRMTLLLHDVGKPHSKQTDSRGVDHFKGHPQKSVELAQNVLKRFRASNAYTNKVLTLIGVHDDYIKEDRTNIKCWLRALGEETTYEYIDVKIADLLSHNLDLSQHEVDGLVRIKSLVQDVINSNEPYQISDLDINGAHLQSIGIKGPDISLTLNKLLDIVIQNPSLNNREELLKIAKD